MTRELIWTGFVSADGIADSPGGESEGHPGGGWLFRTEFVPESFELKATELEETSALMFGHRSYDAFADFWPTSSDHVEYNPLPKYVVSTTLKQSDLIEGWGELTILRSTDEVAALKQTEGGAIFIHGSIELGRRLGEAGLIDRYNLLIYPVLLGKGKAIFPGQETVEQRLVLREFDAYSNGVIKAVYALQR